MCLASLAPRPPPFFGLRFAFAEEYNITLRGNCGITVDWENFAVNNQP